MVDINTIANGVQVLGLLVLSLDFAHRALFPPQALSEEDVKRIADETAMLRTVALMDNHKAAYHHRPDYDFCSDCGVSYLRSKLQSVESQTFRPIGRAAWPGVYVQEFNYIETDILLYCPSHQKPYDRIVGVHREYDGLFSGGAVVQKRYEKRHESVKAKPMWFETVDEQGKPVTAD